MPPIEDLPVALRTTWDEWVRTRFSDLEFERAQLTADRLNAIPGMRCVMPQGAFYAMPQVALPPGRTDEDYVLALLRDTGVLVV